MHHRYEIRGNNLRVNQGIDENGNNIVRNVHSVLTFQREHQRMECINRDRNAALNIRKLVDAALNDLHRPLNFCRGHEPQGLPLQVPPPP